LSKKTVIFDLDGTLIDSIKDIAICCNIILEKNEYKTHEIEAYNHFAGDGIKMLVKNAMDKNTSEEIVDNISMQMRGIYDNGKVHENTKPYDGIVELLDDLKELNYSLSVLSNKPHNATNAYVNHLFKDTIFDEVHGQKEGIPRKPDPIGAINIANTLNTNPKDIYFVGDTSTDMKTAKGAGMIAIGVAWGFRDKSELLAHGADYIAHDAKELFEILSK
jgi:phosphoglycolate phosphatase